MNEIPPQKVK